MGHGTARILVAARDIWLIKMFYLWFTNELWREQGTYVALKYFTVVELKRYVCFYFLIILLTYCLLTFGGLHETAQVITVLYHFSWFVLKFLKNWHLSVFIFMISQIKIVCLTLTNHTSALMTPVYINL